MDQWKYERPEVQGEVEEEKSKSSQKKLQSMTQTHCGSTCDYSGNTFIVMCWLTEICHRVPSKEGKEGSPRHPFPITQQKRCSPEPERKEGDFWKKWLLWLRDMHGLSVPSYEGKHRVGAGEDELLENWSSLKPQPQQPGSMHQILQLKSQVKKVEHDPAAE